MLRNIFGLFVLILGLASVLAEDEVLPVKELKYDEHFYCTENCVDASAVDCGDILTNENEAPGIKLLKSPVENADNKKTYYVYCTRDESNSPWTIIHRRRDEAVEFYNRTWNDYKEGFGDLTTNYWLGLERLHQLTSTNDYELKIELNLHVRETNYSIVYETFAVGNETSGYELTVGKSAGNLADRLKTGSKFSTSDKDNDNTPWIQCAVENGPWWYHGEKCDGANPNGVYSEYLLHKKVAAWEFFEGTFKYFTMSIRRKPKGVIPGEKPVEDNEIPQKE